MPVLFDHVAIGAAHISDASPFIAGELGGVPGFGGPAGPYRFWHWDFPGPGRIEVIEPNGPPGGFVHRFLERNGPGIHHVTFKVSSLPEACELARSLGYDIVGYDDSNAHWQEAFLHPKQAMGIVVQMVEQAARTNEGGGHDAGRGDIPPEPPEPPPPVTVVGVRMRTSDRDRAVRQWGALLQGEVSEEPGELQFRWPESGMRVAVTVESGAPDASDSIELRTDRSLRLPSGPHPVLGASFRQISSA
jgi:hypothetical protein